MASRISASNVGVRADEPALLDARDGPRSRDDGIRVLRTPDVPERRRELAAMFIDGERMVSIEDVNPKPCFEEIEGRPANPLDAERLEAERADRIPNSDHLHVSPLRVLQQPALFGRNILKVWQAPR